MFGSDVPWIEGIFWISTVLGGTLFILRTVLMFIGGDLELGGADGDIDLGGELHLDFDGDVSGDFDGDHADADTSFKALSLQGLTAFFMMFGLVGLALTRANLHAVFSISGAVIAGMFTVWVIGMIFAGMRSLESSGTINVANAVGATGTVYLTIPAKGSGQVQVAVQGSLKIFDAIAKRKKKIATGEKVRVVEVMDGKTLIVETIDN